MVLPTVLRNVILLYCPGIRLWHPSQVVTHGRSETKQNFKLLALNEVAVAYERWLLTRGAKYSDLTTRKLLAVLQGKVVSYER